MPIYIFTIVELYMMYMYRMDDLYKKIHKQIMQ